MTTMNDAPLGYMPIPTVERLADALANVRCFHDLSAELIAPELLKNLLAAIAANPTQQGEAVEVVAYRVSLPSEPELGHWFDEHAEGEPQMCQHEPLMTVAQHKRIVAALSAQQSAQPEFCCEHSYKVAKQAAWGALDLTQCKCDHNEYCEHCWPDDFREGGKWHGKFVAQQSAHVSMPRELLAGVIEYCDQLLGELNGMYQYAGSTGDDKQHDDEDYAQLRAILNGGEA